MEFHHKSSTITLEDSSEIPVGTLEEILEITSKNLEDFFPGIHERLPDDSWKTPVGVIRQTFRIIPDVYFKNLQRVICDKHCLSQDKKGI